MKSVRLLVLLLGILFVLPAAVMLRPGIALADAPALTKEQLTSMCADSVMDYAMTLAMAAQMGVPKKDIVEMNKGAPAVVFKLIDAIYDGAPFTQEDMTALVDSCVKVNSHMLSKKI
jgi:hypothetical protein